MLSRVTANNVLDLIAVQQMAKFLPTHRVARSVCGSKAPFSDNVYGAIYAANLYTYYY